METLLDLRENIRFVHRHGHRANRIVSSMMEMVQNSENRFQESAINDLIESFIEIAWNSMSDEIRAMDVLLDEEYGDCGTWVIKEQELGRAIMNLVRNALESIYLRLSREGSDYEPTLTIITAIEMDKLIIKIRDNGVGIDEHNLERIFAPFFTTHNPDQGNIGLGLFISYEIIVNEHGGDLLITSEPNLHTTAEIRLPKSDVSAGLE